MDADVKHKTYRFGDFVLDVGAHELRLRGERVRLERRPFQLLSLLVERAGLLVTREEIISALWPSRVVIDFDTGVNTLVRKVRQALGDNPDAPACIETVPGLGYRFVARLESAAPPAADPGTPSFEASDPAAKRGSVRRLAAVSVLVIALGAVAVFFAAQVARERNPTTIRIAVLPFENLTGDEGLNYLAAGLAEDTSASLAQLNLRNLRLAGRASALAGAHSGLPIAQVGRDLGVQFVVTGSLRAEGSRIRVMSRLVRVADNVEVWTASIDRELISMLGLQQELSIAIAEQVRLRLSDDVREVMARRQTQSPKAFDLYLRGRYQWSQLSPPGNRQALELYHQAIADDPGYALAWAGIAHVLSTAPMTSDVEPATVSSAARVAIDNALEFGAELAEVQLGLGYYHYFLDWDWPAAEAALRSAVALDPNSAIAHLMLGHVLSQTGEHAEARQMARRARELDPFFSHTFALSATMAFQQHDFEGAVAFGRQAVAINPEGWVGHLNLGQAQAALGQYEEALDSLERAAHFSGGNAKSIAYRAYILARMGRADQARAAIAALEARSGERFVPPYVIALVHAGLGEHDLALDWLERALLEEDVHLVFLTVDPRWDELRNDPRFRSLVDRCQFFGPDPAHH